MIYSIHIADDNKVPWVCRTEYNLSDPQTSAVCVRVVVESKNSFVGINT